MKKNLLLAFLITGAMFSCSENNSLAFNVIKNDIRPPAYPLITIDPYTSGWSFTNNLYDSSVKHWTGKDFPLIGAIKVDNEVYRFMGTEDLELNAIAKTSEYGDWTGKYTTDKPVDTWMKNDFDDSKWKEGTAAFGTRENEVTAKTQWGSEYIWTRRVVDIEDDLKGKNVYLEYSHDDDAIIYVNGIEVVNTGNAAKKNVLIKLPENVVNSLVKGTNVIAGYCYNRVGNGLLDYGLFVEKENTTFFNKTATQKSVDVQATQTHYVFSCGNVDLKLTFTAPLLMHDLKLLSRPINYISYEVLSTDNKAHDVQLYLETSSSWALDKPHQESESEGFENGDMLFLKTGSSTQNILAKKGDDLRIDWGYFYLATENDKATTSSIGEGKELRTNFVNNVQKASNEKRIGTNEKLAFTRSLGSVNKVSGKFLLGYDDLYSIQYFGENLRAYWNADGTKNILDEFHKAKEEYAQLLAKCYKFDESLMNDAAQAGGKKYAELCAIAYRQSISAHKLVEAPNKDLLFLSKENFSNGSIGTVDITYPSAPLFLYYNVELAKGLLNHIFYYSESGKWAKPFAAHDIGTYPLANGQTYGGDMPVEESGNMIIITAAIATVEGNADYAKKHWDILTVWTDYLVEKGLDPESQLCTDDFAGHFAHNTNLSIKAILGIASYGRLAEMLGKKDVAEKYTAIARGMAAEWVKMADDGDHYRLTFDQSGTWSQKYNLVWDKLMKMGIFSAEVAEKEVAYYLTKQNKYGLPLDNRETYTKTDWIIWTATLADNRATFEEFIAPVHLFMNETTDRIPMSDWVFTDRPNQRGFQARSVVGGYFIKMLETKLDQKK